MGTGATNAAAWWTGRPEIRVTRFIPHTPHPRQHAFLCLPREVERIMLGRAEALYGGAARGGKSDALLMAALQYVDIPGYSAIIMRRESPELYGSEGFIERSIEWLGPTLGLRAWNVTRLTWTFPSGAKLRFGHMQREDDKHDFQGQRFQFCVALGTPILMADDSWRPIEQVRVGDMVATLEGPRRVYKAHRPGVKRCVEVTTPYGRAFVSESHRLLSQFGWVSPLGLRAMRSRAGGNIGESAMELSSASQQQHACRSSDPRQLPERAPRTHPGTGHPATCVCSAGGRSGCATSGGPRQAAPQLPTWYAPLALYEPALRQVEPSSALRDGRDDDFGDHGVRGSLADCRCGSHCDDARSRCCREVGRVGIPLRAGVEGRHPTSWPLDGLESAPAHTRPFPHTPVHPYTSEAMDVAASVLSAWARMVPAGAMEVADLSVEGAAHYVASSGIISSNCGFDELTHFTESQYRYLFSRLDRPAEGPLSEVPLRMRATSNPGGPGHEWVKRRFIDRQVDPDDPEDTPVKARERAFIPARVVDNPSVDRDAYVEQLAFLEPEYRAQLLNGDWDARQPGDWYFDERHLGAAVELGRRYEQRLERDALQGPYGGVVHLGIDWGTSTHSVLGWPLEGGGFFIAREFFSYGEEVTRKTPKILALNEFGLPWGKAFFDGAGIESQRTFNSVRDKLLGLGGPAARGIQFGAPNPRTAGAARRSLKGLGCSYLRRLARRSHGIHVLGNLEVTERTEGAMFIPGPLPGHLAISPRCPELVRQLRAIERDPENPTDAWRKDDDQHGPDALVACVATTAKNFRAPPSLPREVTAA